MNLQQVIDAIYEMDKNEVNEVVVAVKARRSQMRTVETLKFRVGQQVSFVGSFGRTIEGTIDKINSKSIGVSVGAGRGWRVAPSLLTIID
jgi:hypothetical protein